jgi:hypothetical protein
MPWAADTIADSLNVLSAESQPTFRRNISPSSSGSNKPSRLCHLLSPWYHSRLILWPWRWRRYVPPKRRLTFSELHGVISQKPLQHICTIYCNEIITPLRNEFLETDLASELELEVKAHKTHTILKKSSVIWDITPWSPLKVNRRFGRTCSLYLQGRISSSCYLLHAGFLFGLIFDTEDGGDIFLRNVGCLSTNYTALYLRWETSS